MIKTVIRTFVINIFALWLVSTLITSFHLAQGVRSLLLVGAGFTLLHLLVKPIASMILGPINFLTLGFIDLLLDAAILYALTIYFPQITISSWSFAGLTVEGVIIPAYNFNMLETTVLSAAFINIITTGLNLLV